MKKAVKDKKLILFFSTSFFLRSFKNLVGGTFQLQATSATTIAELKENIAEHEETEKSCIR
jgi:hypothetical protein